MERRIGILGGTFDPPHMGHLWLAEAASVQTNLDLVLFMPVGQPPHKPDKRITAISHRLEMTRLAIDDNRKFRLDITDIVRQPPHTTNSLYPLIRSKYPSSEIYLLIGADSLRDIPGWENPVGIVEQYRLAVYPRQGVVIDWAKLKTAVPNIETAVEFIDGPVLPISSTELRIWVHKGNSIRYLVPAQVLDYIQEQKLYR